MEALVIPDLAGIPVVWSRWLCTHVQTERTLAQRLFSRPWRPWVRYDQQIEPVAMLVRDQRTGAPSMIVAHPAMRERLGQLEIQGLEGPPTVAIDGVKTL